MSLDDVFVFSSERSSEFLRPDEFVQRRCLPRNLRAAIANVQQSLIDLPIIESILPSNRQHLHSCIAQIMDTGCKKIGVLGFSFKEGTDDLRENPAVELVESLLGKGLNLKVYEPTISSTSIHGANLRFIERSIPHIWKTIENDLPSVVQGQ